MRKALLLSCLCTAIASPSFATQKPKGPVHLSCSLNVYTYDDMIEGFDVPSQEAGMPSQHEIGSVSHSIGAEAMFEYQEYAADGAMRCVQGCDAPRWRFTHLSAPDHLPQSRLVLPNVADYPFPTIRLLKSGEKTQVDVDFEARHRRRDDSIAAGRSKDYQPSSGRVPVLGDGQIIVSAEAGEDGGANSDALVERFQATGQSQFERSRTYDEFRCDEVKPGRLSKFEIAAALSSPPAPGTIGYEEYDKRGGNLTDNLNGRFADVVALARTVDPRQREAAISKLDIEDTGDRVGELLPLLQKALREKPEMTVAEMWSRLAEGMGIDAMSPRAIVSAELLPLMLAQTP